jgi:hypothetical protein
MSLNKVFKPLFCLLLFFLFAGCEYQIDKTYFREVSKNVPVPDLQVNLNIDKDTIYIYGNPTVKLNLLLTNKRLMAVKFFVNNAEATANVYPSTPGSYSLYIDMFQKTVIKIRVEIYTSTETGSIADKIGAESFVFKSQEWTLFYDSQLPVCTSEIVNGRLKLSWTPDRNSITGKYFVSSGDKVDSTIAPYFIDSSYAGGPKSYYVRIKDNSLSSYFISTDINYPLPKLYLNNKDSFVIYWDKSKFFNNISGYRLQIGDSSVEVNANDTFYIFKNGFFGMGYSIRADLHLNKPGLYTGIYSNFGYVYAVYKLKFLPSYVNKYFPLVGSSLYYYDNSSIFQFSVPQKSVITSLQAPWLRYIAISPNNKYILYSDNTDGLNLINTSGMTSVNEMPITNIISNNIFFGLVISDIGTGVFYDFALAGIKVYDFVNNKLVAQLPVSQGVQLYKISANGKYIFEPVLNSLFKIQSNSIIRVWGDESQASQYKFFEFYPDNSNKIAVYDGSTFFIKSCIDFSNISSFPLDNTYIINIDFSQNKILTFANNVFTIINLSDGTIQNNIPGYLNANNIKLFNNYIFGESQLNLNDL